MSKLSFLFDNPIFLQTDPGSLLTQFGPLILIIGVFYFFFIRPQSQKQKEQTSFVDSLEKGQKVVTSSGIHGQINKIEDTVVTLQVDNKTFIRIERGAISKEMTDALTEPEKSA